MSVEGVDEQLREDLVLYALDALPASESAAIERALSERPELWQIVIENREALASTTPASLPPAPDRVWDNIASAIGLDDGDAEVVAADRRIESDANHREAPSSGNVAPFPSQRIASGWMWKVAVAASVAAVVSFGLGRASVGGGDPLETLAKQVAESPGSVTATLEADGVAAQIVLAESGEGFLLTDNLPALDPSRTYQLWAVTAGGVTSAGVLGSDPGVVAFHTARAHEVEALVITEENAGGVVTSEGTVVATWGV